MAAAQSGDKAAFPPEGPRSCCYHRSEKGNSRSFEKLFAILTGVFNSLTILTSPSSVFLETLGICDSGNWEQPRSIWYIPSAYGEPRFGSPGPHC